MTQDKRSEFIRRQKETCKAKGWPFFMPGNGICWHCGGDMVKAEMENGNDGSGLVTGCRCCCKSYCD